jgi:excisionase family DNA binding protein
MKSDELLSTAQAAEHLGVTRQRVLELITGERLPAIKVGRAYVVRSSDLFALTLGKAGRPPKSKDAAEKSLAKKRVRKKDPARLLKTLS